MRIVLLISLLLVLMGCEERYRYKCQDPKNFALKQCQRPDCLFTQDCPDYLVAPVLEKTNVPQASQAASAPADR
jgi:hypothetical protein